MHAIEKILAKAAGKATITTGEIVNCKVDICLLYTSDAADE